MAGFTYRNIVENDLPAVISMIKELAHAEGRPDAATITRDLLWPLLFGDEAIASGIIGFVGDEAAGYALFAHKFSSFKGYRIGYLEDILVTSKFRGDGVGQLMMAAAAQQAIDLGFKALEWSALNTNLEAIGFYDHIGAARESGRTHFEYDFTMLKQQATLLG